MQPDRSPIRALDAGTLSTRLRLLAERAGGLTRLRQAFREPAPISARSHLYSGHPHQLR